MKNIKLDYSRTLDFLSKEDITKKQKEAEKCNQKLEDKSGKGSDFLGWVNLPSSITDEQLTDIENTAKKLKDKKIDFLIVIGIGGSYLGAKAVIEALSDSFVGLDSSDSPVVLFAGQNISEDYLSELKSLLQNKEYALCVISKSGTTTEPAIAFRMLRAELEKNYGEDEARERIIAVTDESKGALRKLADTNDYKTYVIPDDVGGRYSVLTPVGLVAIAVAGFDIRALVQGAKDMEEETAADVPFDKNIATQYATIRNILYEKEYKIEILVNYHPKLQYLSEWWKQLYGESEGKEHKGIFPSSANFTADLHSMGQYIQEGLRNIFETVITIEEPNSNLSIKKDEDNLDGLNYLADKRIDEVNKMAELGTTIAHVDGGVPNLKIEVPKLNEYYIGQIIYFFERACGISGYLLGVNPFDQPGVEAYKSNMFALLEKPGYEEQTKKIKSKL